MSKILCPEPGSQLTIGSTTVPITPAPAEPVGGTPRTDTLAKDERHLTVAETRYWCDQYKTLARQLECEARANAEMSQFNYDRAEKAERELGEANVKIQSAWDSYRTAFDNYARAEREVAGMRADAERYRWLRQRANTWTVKSFTNNHWRTLMMEYLDEAIDAARQEERKEGK